jgi:uncharacterized protein YjgD (DUF1641 family)
MEANDALELERLAAAARDSLTDEMVGRLSATAADGMDLLDQVNRSGVGKALPALAQLVANGDLDRLVALARTYGAAQDAMTDEIVTRMADTMGASLSLMDRLNRAGVDRLIGLLEQVVGALDAANREISGKPAAAGGFGGLWQLMRDPENQETLRFMLALGRGMRGGKTAR